MESKIAASRLEDLFQQIAADPAASKDLLTRFSSWTDKDLFDLFLRDKRALVTLVADAWVPN